MKFKIGKKEGTKSKEEKNRERVLVARVSRSMRVPRVFCEEPWKPMKRDTSIALRESNREIIIESL